MTTPKSRKVPATTVSKIDALVAAHNELNSALAAAGLLPHHSPAAAIATADASDDATLIALSNALTSAYTAHIADTDAHVAADATNTLAAVTTIATKGGARTRINDIKAKLNAHGVLAASHRSVAPFGGLLDTIATVDGSDAGTTQTLANAIKALANRAAAGKLITLADGSDDTTDRALANQLKNVLNRHITGGSSLISIVPS